MKKSNAIHFDHFLEKFPEVQLPIVLSEDAHFDFSKNNDPLPLPMIEQFIIPLQGEPLDEFTEYVPCFQVSDAEKFTAVVFWKAVLLTYQFVLVTFDKKGNFIDKSVIAGTKAEGDSLIRSVATIDEDWIIYVMVGVASSKDQLYDPSNSKSFHLELLDNGKIINSN